MALGSASIRAGSAAAHYRAGLARRQEALRRRRQRLWRRAEEARHRQRRALDRHRELELIIRALFVLWLWLSPLNGRVCRTSPTASLTPGTHFESSCVEFNGIL